MLEEIMANSEIIITIFGLVGMGIVKVFSDKGRKDLVKELDEAKEATVKAAKNAAPVLDLAFNVGIGKVPLNEDTLKTLSAGASVAWIDTKNLSKEVKDVLDQFAEKKGVLKP